MQNSLLFAITIVYVILIGGAYCEISTDHLTQLEWDNRILYNAMVKKYGMPTALNPERGGGAIWNLSSQVISLFDQKFGVEPEPCVHITTPIKLFAGLNPQTVKISDQVAHKRIGEIIGILPKYISYDQVRNTITTRFFNPQIATLLTMLCMKITTGELTLPETKEELTSFCSPKEIPRLVTDADNYIHQYIEIFN